MKQDIKGVTIKRYIKYVKINGEKMNMLKKQATEESYMER